VLSTITFSSFVVMSNIDTRWPILVITRAIRVINRDTHALITPLYHAHVNRLVSGVAVCLAALTAAADAQPAEVTGHVVDAESGEPITGATLLLGDQDAATDDTGAFTIMGGGTITVIASGYTAVSVRAKRGMVVRLRRVSGELIEIQGTSPEESKSIAYTMSAKDVASTPGERIGPIGPSRVRDRRARDQAIAVELVA
jgi:hypothetical protein